MLLKLIIILNASLGLWANSIKKDLTNAGVHPVFTAVIPMLLGHPFLLLAVYLSGYWSLPTSAEFYAYFFALCSLYIAGSYLALYGLTKSNFASANAILSTGVVFQTILAVILLDEKISAFGIACFIILTLTLIKINFLDKFKFKLDQGSLLITISVLILALGVIFFKKSATLTNSYGQFLTGRTLSDLIFYSGFHLLLPFFNKKSIKENYAHFFSTQSAWLYIFVFNIIATVNTVLYFYLNASTIVILSAITHPISFFIGRKKYQEKYTLTIIIENLIIILAIIGFLLS